MQNNQTTVLTPKDLPAALHDSLTLRFARPQDGEQLQELAFRVLDEGNQDLPAVRILLQDMAAGKVPHFGYEDFTVVEDSRSAQIVSAMCLMSQIWRYDGLPVRVGRPELVMTDPEYRRRGLIARQFEVIHALSAARGELMQGITGIFGFYRRFGYEMALDLGGGYQIFPAQFPPLPAGSSPAYRLRSEQNQADRDFIRRLHELYTYRQLWAIQVEDAVWEAEFRFRQGSDARREWRLIEDQDGNRLGYVQHNHLLWGRLFAINFVGLEDGVGYLHLLPHLLHGLYQIGCEKLQQDAFKHPSKQVKGLALRLGREHPLYGAIGSEQMIRSPAYAWYLRVADIPALLRAVRPALEKRLSKSVAAGYTGRLRVNAGDKGFEMQFRHGRLRAIRSWEPPEIGAGDAHFPEKTFLYLIGGRHTVAEVCDTVADAHTTREARVLLAALFPRFTGAIWIPGG